jgi:hypothetical protein
LPFDKLGLNITLSHNGMHGFNIASQDIQRIQRIELQSVMKFNDFSLVVRHYAGFLGAISTSLRTEPTISCAGLKEEKAANKLFTN